MLLKNHPIAKMQDMYRFELLIDVQDLNYEELETTNFSKLHVVIVNRREKNTEFLS